MPNKYAQFSKRQNNHHKLNIEFFPQATLDYHNQGPLTEYDITKQLEDFIEESQIQGVSNLLIITGKGINSKNGPVIRPLILKLLKNDKLVTKYNLASEINGGDGAIEVTILEK